MEKVLAAATGDPAARKPKKPLDGKLMYDLAVSTLKILAETSQELRQQLHEERMVVKSLQEKVNDLLVRVSGLEETQPSTQQIKVPVPAPAAHVAYTEEFWPRRLDDPNDSCLNYAAYNSGVESPSQASNAFPAHLQELDRSVSQPPKRLSFEDAEHGTVLPTAQILLEPTLQKPSRAEPNRAEPQTKKNILEQKPTVHQEAEKKRKRGRSSSCDRKESTDSEAPAKKYKKSVEMDRQDRQPRKRRDQVRQGVTLYNTLKALSTYKNRPFRERIVTVLKALCTEIGANDEDTLTPDQMGTLASKKNLINDFPKTEYAKLFGDLKDNPSYWAIVMAKYKEFKPLTRPPNMPRPKKATSPSPKKLPDNPCGQGLEV